MSQRSHMVLIVDDEPAISRLLVTLLERSGFRALVAANAERGFELALSANPSLILCDERMPGGNGDELLRQVKSHSITAAIPVVMMGGSGAQGLRDWEREGAAAFISKPFEMTDVMTVIRKILSNDQTPAR